MPLLYADASALVKLVLQEPESDALERFVQDADLLSSELVLTELPRAVRRASAAHETFRLGTLLERVDEVLESIALLPADREVLSAAGSLAEPRLRSLDAVHVASALEVSPVDGFVSYDERQAAVARLAGLRTVAPSG